MWHIYNLVRIGDLVTAKTFRKVTSISAAGTGQSERVVIKLTVQVEATDFDPIGNDPLAEVWGRMVRCAHASQDARHCILPLFLLVVIDLSPG